MKPTAKRIRYIVACIAISIVLLSIGLFLIFNSSYFGDKYGNISIEEKYTSYPTELLRTEVNYYTIAFRTTGILIFSLGGAGLLLCCVGLYMLYEPVKQ